MTEKIWLENYEPAVPAEVEIPTFPLSQLITTAAQKYGDKVGVRMVLKYLPLGLSIQAKMTFRELDEESNRFAAALQKLGVARGDRVAIMLPNLPQGAVAYFGILKAGAVVVNTNPTYTKRELNHLLEDSGAQTIVTISGLVKTVRDARDGTSLKNIIVTDVSSMLGWPFNKLTEKQLRERGTMTDVPSAPDIHRYEDIMRSAGRPNIVQTDPDETVLFQYTGGTTGRSKAAMLTNRNLVANIAQSAAWFQAAEGKEKMLCALPFFHVYGMTVAKLVGIHVGAELVVVPDPRNTEHIMEVIAKEKVTYYPGVPAMYVGIINHPKVNDFDLSSVKCCFSGGAALPVEVAQRFAKLSGGRLVEGYGLTECAPVACGNPIVSGEIRFGSIGMPVSSTDVAVVSLEADENGKYKRLAQGEEGEIVIYGPQVMKGYWNQPEETAETIDPDGGLHTGDIGRMDEDGYFYIVDRKKDLIIASGYNIVPREVEEVLFMHDKVLEAAVAGVPDEKRGETVKAYVVLKEGQSCTVDEVRAFCKENLAPYKVPRMVEFRDELPKSQVGKVLRRILVEEEKQKLAQKETA